ncbi:MAG: hypothetical protein HN576_05085 [Bacteriovoracaceae bacterium]|jgi:hypothetical protein|nr:hypothetical protein [Bacteriovoracaceae bacterium]
MRKGIQITLTVFMLAWGTSFACDINGTSGIVEDNNLLIPVGAKSVGEVTEVKFNEILDKVEAIYAPVIEAKGKTLQVIRKWEDATVNAYAQQTGNVWKISMFGGLARHDTITADAFALVACHELGHHLGGFPKKRSIWSSSWASNEGQSDYWGNMKCLRKFMEKDDNTAIVAQMTVPSEATKRCQANFNNADDLAMCQRGAMAGLSLGNLFKALRRLTVDLKFDTPDTTVARTTNHSHPAPQCRLDTYFAGALCEQDAYTDVSNTNAATGVCVRNTHDDGIRPLCWYKPKAE